MKENENLEMSKGFFFYGNENPEISEGFFLFFYTKGWVEFGYIVFELNGPQWVFS